jgi:hypothetical protein
MNVLLEGRAEIALRSLDPPERQSVQAALEVLEHADLGALKSSGKLHAMKLSSPERLYSFRVNKMLRLILSERLSQWIVEDIVNHDRLARLLPATAR